MKYNTSDIRFRLMYLNKFNLDTTQITTIIKCSGNLNSMTF